MKVKAVAKPSAKSLKPKTKKLKPDLVKVKKSKKPKKTENESSEGENCILKLKPKSDTKPKSTIKTGKSKGKDNFLVKHKKDLEGLKDIDPEFYQFLKQNDKKLLEFDFDDSDDEDDDDAKGEDKNDEKDSQSGDDDEDEERVHKPSGELEVASDESDFEADDDDEDDNDDDDDDGNEEKEKSGVKSKTITLKLLKTWQVNLQEKHPSIETIRKIIKAFSSALSSLTGEKSKLSIYKVEGSAIFNGIIQLCVINLQPAIMGFLGFHQKSKRPLHKCKKWKRIRNPLRGYLTDLMKLLEHVSSSNILTVLLKHLHQMSNMLGSFTSISKTILKRLIVLWSTCSEETVRVLSFLCILKITRNQQISLLNHVLKAMYLSYIRNSKFVSPNTLPNINFMRRSLVEMFALDLNVSYQHVFLYIRQLAIHLRNAIILKKKDSFQAIYNWQYINSIRLWSDLLGITSNKLQLQPLIYPLINIIIGVIKLIPTAQYFPLRFHCIQTLINLQSKSNIFIPILPFILEVLNSNTFNKKHTIVSMKPIQFTCILRLNKTQLCENGFRNEVIENVFNLLLQYLSNESSSLSYSDLIVPTIFHLKNYIKICKNSNYIRKLKQLLDKIIENSKFIDNERQKITFDLKNLKEIQAWETKIKNNGTPLHNYYINWLKTHEMKKRRQAADTDEINKYDIPFIKRRKIDGNINDIKNNGKDVELFPSDDEDDDDVGKQLLNGSDEDENEGVSKNKNEKKKSKKQKQNIVQKQKNPEEEQQQEDNDDFDDAGEVDIVKDLDIDDW